MIIAYSMTSRTEVWGIMSFLDLVSHMHYSRITYLSNNIGMSLLFTLVHIETDINACGACVVCVPRIGLLCQFACMHSYCLTFLNLISTSYFGAP